MSTFPVTRLRRLRRTSGLRDLVRETRLDLDDFVMPLFVGPEPLANSDLPGMARHSVDSLDAEADELVRLGVKGVILFGIPDEKDEEGSGAWDDDGIVQRALRALHGRDLVLITDVCLCEYTSHGHCGVIGDGDEIDNDATLELLARTARSHVEAGADVVAPSDMMDGRVGAIREELPEERRSSPTRRSTPLPSTARSARPPSRRLRSETGAATRWIPRTCAKHCASASRTWPRAQTS